MRVDVVMDRGDQIRNTREAVAADAVGCEVSQEAFNDVQPGTARWNEVEVKTGMLLQPALYFGVVSSVVVEDQMDG